MGPHPTSGRERKAERGYFHQARRRRAFAGTLGPEGRITVSGEKIDALRTFSSKNG